MISMGEDHVGVNLSHVYLVLYAFVGEWVMIEYVRACVTADVTVETCSHVNVFQSTREPSLSYHQSSTLHLCRHPCPLWVHTSCTTPSLPSNTWEVVVYNSPRRVIVQIACVFTLHTILSTIMCAHTISFGQTRLITYFRHPFETEIISLKNKYWSFLTFHTQFTYIYSSNACVATDSKENSHVHAQLQSIQIWQQRIRRRHYS